MLPRVAVLIPCYNEALSIGKVVSDYIGALPGAVIYVYDNASTDDTAGVAAAAGAVVRHEALRGKGNVVRRMFADIEADVYLLVDGDDTYDAVDAVEMVRRVLEQDHDMVVGTRRVDAGSGLAYRSGHVLGNRLFTMAVAALFGDRFTDVFSGYRAFSRRFVKSFPSGLGGFEIETELTVHALSLRMPVSELPSRYRERPNGSSSKLRTYQDGTRILLAIALLFKELRPARFFGLPFLVLATSSVALGIPILFTYIETGLVPRFPTAILATGLMLMAVFSLGCGIILDSVARGREESKRMVYLSIPGPLGRRFDPPAWMDHVQPGAEPARVDPLRVN